MPRGNGHVAAIQLAPGSSEAIAHGIGKHREVNKLLLVSLHTDISLLRLIISAGTKYSLCPEYSAALLDGACVLVSSPGSRPCLGGWGTPLHLASLA